MYIPRKQTENILVWLQPGKVTVLYGARRVGKTTLIAKLANEMKTTGQDILFINGDDIVAREYLESQSIQKLKDFVGKSTLLIIDEAQYIKKIGLTLKLIVDHIPDIRIIATGSSSFDLSKDMGEPLTGRKYTLRLYPISQLELSGLEKHHESKAYLEARLLYGSYPEIIGMHDNAGRERYLRELVRDYLFKDILELEPIRHSDKLLRLLQLLAFQIGKAVSVNELGGHLGMSKNTVSRYLDLLEKVFVIYQRCGFSRNLRKEITKNHRYYFYDNGIRNAVIQNFNPLNLRNDRGMLWENYILSERLKRNEYLNQQPSSYFWRTWDKKEIDLVEDSGGKISGFEIKWKESNIKAPGDWQKHYPDADFSIIHQNNYMEFIR